MQCNYQARPKIRKWAEKSRLGNLNLAPIAGEGNLMRQPNQLKGDF
jgi:hypothetical protein